MNKYNGNKINAKILVFVAVMLLSIMAVTATWTAGEIFTPSIKQAGISPVTATATQGDSGILTVIVFPQHPTQSSAAFNKFYSFTIDGSYDSGLEIVSIDPSQALVDAGWTITPSLNNNAKTFTVRGNIGLGSPGFITNKATALLTINVRSTAIGAQIVRLTGVQMLVAGQNGITDFNHIATITLDACVPSCPSQNTICLGTTDTSSNSCGGNCNVIGTKVDEECTPQNECAPNGVRQCSGNGLQTCGNYDNDAALEWSVVTACNPGETCANGACAAPAPATKKQQVRQQVDALIDAANIPEDRSTPEGRNAFLTFISNLANTLKNLFP